MIKKIKLPIILLDPNLRVLAPLIQAHLLSVKVPVRVLVLAIDSTGFTGRE